MKKSSTFAAVNNQQIYKNKSLTNKVLSFNEKIYEENE